MNKKIKLISTLTLASLIVSGCSPVIRDDVYEKESFRISYHIMSDDHWNDHIMLQGNTFSTYATKDDLYLTYFKSLPQSGVDALAQLEDPEDRWYEAYAKSVNNDAMEVVTKTVDNKYYRMQYKYNYDLDYSKYFFK